MKHAFPYDELDPVTCKSRGLHLGYDTLQLYERDVMGNFSLTLVDSLDALAVLGDCDGFAQAVKDTIEYVQFDIDSTVQVFEVTIRMLGGLISAHLIATDPKDTLKCASAMKSWYNTQLLDMAYDLGKRLLPAFTSSGSALPLPRINLKDGVVQRNLGYSTETNTASVGTLILEFATLSRLTGDSRFEQMAKDALFEIWARRSDIDLLGNRIDSRSLEWTEKISSTGGGIDSFFEYALKAYVALGDNDYLALFNAAYSALQRGSRDSLGYIYLNVHMDSGELASPWIDSLSAFVPGMQVLAGDIEGAVRTHLVYYNIWKRYSAMPEVYDLFVHNATVPGYPGRPEFVESTYLLYQATKDPFYLDVGAMILRDLQQRTRTKCGFGGLKAVTEFHLEPRMESFMLSETLKYLYLLFDTDHPLNKLDTPYVFTTEGFAISAGIPFG
ncbi:glycoside hydrolase [Ramicandelaber brevisporus]|nr:glycoside hydrolase [Ramicandelaber brevisporus]KAI8866840.1 glycoside hydrolase [Ramicandelaber brevisporus]